MNEKMFLLPLRLGYSILTGAYFSTAFECKFIHYSRSRSYDSEKLIT
jgi:hypothetical protein